MKTFSKGEFNWESKKGKRKEKQEEKQKAMKRCLASFVCKLKTLLSAIKKSSKQQESPKAWLKKTRNAMKSRTPTT